MKQLHEVYLDRLRARLERAGRVNATALIEAARIMALTVERGGVIHAFGNGHSQLLAVDLAGRPGALAAVNVIHDPAQGRAEQLEGYALTLLGDVVFEPADCLIVISNSGLEPLPVEMALAGSAAGIPVIAVTSSRRAGARHSSRRRLWEIANVVLDLCGQEGGTTVQLPSGIWVGPSSTVVGAALMHAAAALAAEYVERDGMPSPVLVAQHLEGAADRNAELRARYRARALGLL